MRLLGRIVLALIGIAVIALIIVYAGSEYIIRRAHDVPLAEVAVPKDAASIAEGGRLARIEGCRGCHSDDGAGSVWSDPPWFVASVAPPGIARKIASYSDAELLRLIRNGVRKDGSTLFIMPTVSLRNISDDDAGKIIAWMRTLQPGPKDVTQDMGFGPVGRAMLLFGKMEPSIQTGDIAEVHRPADVGRYYYNAVCSECHLLDKPKPTEDGHQIAPALAPMAASYDPAAFRKLLRTGVGMSNRDLGLMKEVATEGAYALNDDEIAAIQNYLKGEAEKQGAVR
jgi:mono/diheme cytochrome c family protein